MSISTKTCRKGISRGLALSIKACVFGVSWGRVVAFVYTQ